MSTRAQPVVSVLTASRNRSDYLLRKLEHLRQQTLQPGLFEWLVCLDAATDDSRQRLEAELEARPPAFRVAVVESLVQIGPGPARNRAAQLATGRVIYLSDDDCLPEPETLDRHLKAQTEPAVYVGAIEFEEPGGKRSWRPGRLGWWNVNGANTSLPYSSFLQAGGFPDYLEGYGGEDLALGYRLARNGLEIRPLPAARTLHLGPATGRGANPRNWYQAGANAMRLARRHPGMASRLGVEPWQLVLKRLVTPFLGRRGRLEAEYTRGALDERNEGQS